MEHQRTGEDEQLQQKEPDYSLQFDNINLEYTLALEYFKTHQSKFYPCKEQGYETTWKCVYDACNNTIYYKDEYETPLAGQLECKDEHKRVGDGDGKQQSTNISSKRTALAAEIEINAELFAQVEAAIRKVPKEQVLQSDVKLLVQMFRYTTKDKTLRDGADSIIMDNDAPLCKLGLLPPRRKPCKIYASPNRAAVCYLFKELCIKAELDNVKLYFYDDTSKPKSQQVMPGCIGVLSEQADLDSAVDTFLDSTTLYPWKLQTIYIQESVYESAKKVFQWKCKTSNDNPTVFKTNDKNFIFDYSAKSEGVSVEAYRTTKELISILCEKDPPFLSLWCNDIAEVNEICFASNTNVSIIWVNCYGIFDGPERFSEALLSAFELNFNKNITRINDIYSEKLYKIRDAWMRKDVTERAVCLVKGMCDSTAAIEYWTSCKKNCKENNHFVHITPNCLLIGEQKSLMVVAQGQFTGDLVQSLVEGTMVIYKPVNDKQENKEMNYDLAKKLAASGVPVVLWNDKIATKKTVRVVTDVPFMVTRVIRQCF